MNNIYKVNLNVTADAVDGVADGQVSYWAFRENNLHFYQLCISAAQHVLLLIDGPSD